MVCHGMPCRALPAWIASAFPSFFALHASIDGRIHLEKAWIMWIDIDIRLEL
jgi:hypothetical protein